MPCAGVLAADDDLGAHAAKGRSTSQLVPMADVRDDSWADDGTVDDEPCPGDHALEPVAVSLRRLGVIVVVIAVVATSLVLAARAGVQRITAVPGWGYCVMLCHDVPLATVERVSGVDLPDGSSILRSTGVRTDAEVHEWVSATVRVPEAHRVAVDRTGAATGCTSARDVEELRRSDVRAVHRGLVEGRCVIVGVDADGNQVLVL